jgi:hypothetical protein
MALIAIGLAAIDGRLFRSFRRGKITTAPNYETEPVYRETMMDIVLLIDKINLKREFD